MEKQEKTITFKGTETLEQELSKFSFDHDCSKSHLIKTSIDLGFSIIKKHPLLLKYMEFEAVVNNTMVTPE